MADNEQDQRNFTRVHCFVTNQSMPPDDADPAVWIQRATVTIRQLHELAAMAYMSIRHHAPVLLNGSTETAHLLTALGLMLRTIEESGKAFMAAHGIEPLDLHTEQLRLAREKLADPDCPPEMREQLLDMLADALKERPTESEEWAEFLETE